MEKMKNRIKMGVLFVPIFIGGLFLFTWVVMLLWNAVLPAAVPAIKAIGYWQAMGILALSKILFGFGMGGGSKHRRWNQRMEQKMDTMTPEERERFKNEWRNRCGNRWGMAAKHDRPDTAAE